MLNFFFLLMAGLGGGFLAGFLGVGGGIVYIVILPFVLINYGVPPGEVVQFTIANSILGAFFASLSANIVLIKNKNFYWREVFWVTLTSIIVSVLLLKFFVNTPYYSQPLFNFFVIILLAFIFIKTLQNAKTQTRDVLMTPPIQRKLSAAGALGGMVSALTGLGGGAVIIPILNVGLRMDIKKAKSISLGMIFFSTLMMTIFNLFETPHTATDLNTIGYIVLPVILPISLGVIIASPIAVKIAQKVPPHVISYIFAFFLLVVIIKKGFELVPFLSKIS